MATRETVYRKFGPKMIEGLVKLLRSKISELQNFTGAQIIDALDAEIDAIPDYDWMHEEPGNE